MSKDKKPKHSNKNDKKKPKKVDQEHKNRSRREPVELEPELERLIGLATD